MPDPSPLGARLRAARESKGYPSAREAALAAGIHPQQWGDIERGKDARYSTIERIINGLGLDPRGLFPGWDRASPGHRSPPGAR